MRGEQLSVLLTLRSRVLEEISSLLAQEVKHPPVCRCFGHRAEQVSLSSAPLPPQGLAVRHVFPLMAHQTANVDHVMGWEVQEDLLQDIHGDCEELGRGRGRGARVHQVSFRERNTAANHNTNMTEARRVNRVGGRDRMPGLFKYCTET